MKVFMFFASLSALCWLDYELFASLFVSEVGNLLDCGYGCAALSSSHTRPALTKPNFQSPIIPVIPAHNSHFI